MWILINALGVAFSGFIGISLKKFISKNQSQSLMNVLGLLIIFIGIQGALKSENTLMMILSLAIGTFIGSGIGIHDKVGIWIEKLSKNNLNNNLLKNAITVIIIQCSGSLSIIAPLNYSLQADATLLQFKTVLDTSSGIIFSSLYGASVFIAAGFLFIYQGLIYLLAGFIGQFLTTAVITEFSAVASVLLIGVGLDLMKIKEFKTLDYLPSMFIPIVWYILQIIYRSIF